MGWSLIDFTADLTGRGSDASSTPARHRCEKSQQEPESESPRPPYCNRVEAFGLVPLAPCADSSAASHVHRGTSSAASPPARARASVATGSARIDGSCRVRTPKPTVGFCSRHSWRRATAAASRSWWRRDGVFPWSGRSTDRRRACWRTSSSGRRCALASACRTKCRLRWAIDHSQHDIGVARHGYSRRVRVR